MFGKTANQIARFKEAVGGLRVGYVRVIFDRMVYRCESGWMLGTPDGGIRLTDYPGVQASTIYPDLEEIAAAWVRSEI